MSQVNIAFEPPSELVEQYVRDRVQMSFIRGPLGSGKTQATIIKLMAMMREQTPNAQGVRPTRFFIIRNTYPDLMTTTIRDWEAMTGDIAPVKKGHPPSQLIRYRLPDRTIVECDVLFIALDREEHVRKLRGAQGTVAWLNETKELPYAVIEMMDSRLGRYPSRALAGVDCDHAGRIVGDTNAPDSDHWYAKFERDPPEGWKFYVQPGAAHKADGKWQVNINADNIQNLPPGYYDKLIKGKREDWIRVNVANELGVSVDGKAIWPEFSQVFHIREFDTEPGLPVLFGVDFGLTPAMVLAQMMPNGQLQVFDEVVTQNYSTEELADAVITRMSTAWPKLSMGHGWGDPSGTSGSQADKNSPFLVLDANGFSVEPTDTNDFTVRRDAVGHRLTSMTRDAEPEFLVHPRCKVLIRGMAGHYYFKRLKVAGDEAYHDVPHKNMYSHICEALQYLSLGLGDGDRVLGSQTGDWDEPINVPLRRSRNARRR